MFPSINLFQTVKSLGCFQALPALFIPDMVSNDLTPPECFALCDQMLVVARDV